MRSRALKPGRLRLAVIAGSPGCNVTGCSACIFSACRTNPGQRPSTTRSSVATGRCSRNGSRDDLRAVYGQADSCNTAVRTMRPSAADKCSPETSCSWPPRLRRFRGSAMCTISQAVSAETLTHLPTGSAGTSCHAAFRAVCRDAGGYGSVLRTSLAVIPRQGLWPR